jgi:SAM-dependent methyltransferase
LGTVDENRRYWSQYEWPKGGDEWSEVWGGTRNLWFGSLLPRIADYVPTGTVLEIGPGFGRFTHYLKDLCQRLILVDVTERCITACRQRFADADHISYHVNDGRSLDMVPNRAVDFAFSFDSLVHVEADAMEAYVRQIARKLTDHGLAFLHHSNLAAFADPATGALPFENRHWRAESVSGEWLAKVAADCGLVCTVQEIVNWGTENLTDCFSVLTPVGSPHARALRRRENPEFMAEALRLADLGDLYGLERPAAAASPPGDEPG